MSGPLDHETTQDIRTVVRTALERNPTWEELASAGVLGLSIPESAGGEGLGFAAAAVVLDELGRHGLRLPAAGSLAVGPAVIAEFGSAEQHRALLGGVADGSQHLTYGVATPGTTLVESLRSQRFPAVVEDGAVTGYVTGVAAVADATLLIPANAGDTTRVAVVAADAPGVSVTTVPASHGEQYTVRLTDAPCTVLGEGSAQALVRAAVAAEVVLIAGLLAGTRDLTAGYIAERDQFGRKLAEFQAVAQQIADVYVATRMVALAADNAVFRVAQGDTSVDDLAVAAYWACREAPAAGRTCHHLHGGMGVDETYPLPALTAQLTDACNGLGGAAAGLASVRTEASGSAHAELSQAQRSLQAELREYFTTLQPYVEELTTQVDRHGPAYEKMIKQMGTDGWMGVGWPTEHGGHGFGEMEQTIFANEAMRSGVQLPSVTLQTVGPTLMAYGTEKQKQMFLSDILRGDVHFAIGYSEPDAGTDLASLRTTARRDGDHYIVNGQKMWTTGGHHADYVWLAVRTDPEAPKHKGISIMIVDTSDPGYSFTPIITADGSHHVNATYYNDVRVPVDMVVGEENQGWKLITTQLNHERVMLGPAGKLEGLRDRVAAWATAHDVAEEPDVRRVLAEVTAAFRVNELLNWEVAQAAARGEMSVADASASKVFSSEEVQGLGRALSEVVHRYGDPADPQTQNLLVNLDKLLKQSLVLTFGGGVNEVQRELIAMFGLKLPKVPR